MSNIYDDVKLLQQQMNEVLSELPYKLNLRNDGKIVVAVGKDRSAVTATVSIYYVVN